ncbi:MAG: acetylglutamate kinase [Acidobacteriota bacterium]|jgi:acetylglutamate kinase|nr:acetylglutamate kinase [Acidobacteriota bacterium]
MRITIKLGGSILEEAAIRGRLLGQVADIAAAGHEVILVHGGGKSLNRRLAQMQMTSNFIDGLRVTDEATLGVAVMTLAGEVNKKLVTELGALGVKALGICGADAASVRCVPVAGTPGYPAGIGFVGKPSQVNREFFELVVGAGIVPVVSSIALGSDATDGSDGTPDEKPDEKKDAAKSVQLYNINADQMAAACAAGTGCETLVFLTDVPGVMDAGEVVIRQLDKTAILDLRAKGVLSGGMLPKTASCLDAIDAGVQTVYILPGADEDILTEFMGGTLAKGTKINGN